VGFRILIFTIGLAILPNRSFAALSALSCPSDLAGVRQLINNKLHVDGSKLIGPTLEIPAGGIDIDLTLAADGTNGNMFATLNILGAIVTAPIEVCDSAAPGAVGIRVISSLAKQTGKALLTSIDLKIKNILNKGDMNMTLQSPDGGKSVQIVTPLGNGDIPINR
jgi:hypothetical protein